MGFRRLSRGRESSLVCRVIGSIVRVIRYINWQ
nr:MAG TPA: hypothetical protein [Caudoviricetes sp.]